MKNDPIPFLHNGKMILQFNPNDPIEVLERLATSSLDGISVDPDCRQPGLWKEVVRVLAPQPHEPDSVLGKLYASEKWKQYVADFPDHAKGITPYNGYAPLKNGVNARIRKKR
jgi:hypothetical protein